MHIVVDIGGTKTRVAASRDFETLGATKIFPSVQPYEGGVAAIVAAARECASGEHIDAISVGAPGVIAPDHGSLLKCKNLADWKGKPLADDLHVALGGIVHLENDTALCGLGESHFGAGKGVDVMMYMTVSTGVGGARIVRGGLDSPERSAEIGDEYFDMGGELHKFDDYISGRAIQAKFGMPPRDLGKDHGVWEELAREVAIGLHNASLFWTPERIVLGGSMFNEIGIPVDRVRFHLQSIMTALPTIPEVVHSALGDVGGLWGGLALLKQRS